MHVGTVRAITHTRLRFDAAASFLESCGLCWDGGWPVGAGTRRERRDRNKTDHAAKRAQEREARAQRGERDVPPPLLLTVSGRFALGV
jgi:hypothetical protein